MKAEINNENKAKFFALYRGQEIGLGVNQQIDTLTNKKWKAQSAFTECVELKPLSSISDEDAIEVARLISPFSFTTHKKWEIDRLNRSQVGCISTRVYSRKSLHRFDIDEDGRLDVIAEETGMQPRMVIPDFLSAYDFLRSRGYALPWMGLSVDELVKAGWIKLID